MRSTLQQFLAISILALLMLAANVAAAPATQPADTFLNEVKANFAAWDTDHDGVLSANEIELAVHRQETKGPAAAAAVALRRGVRMDGDIAPLSLEKIGGFVAARANRQEAPRLEAMYASALAKIQAAHRELFVSGTPKLETLAQGRLGDCFLLASLGALVDKDPPRLTHLMHATDDGKVAIQYPGRAQMLLPFPTDGEIALGAVTGNDGLWANTFETAIGQIFLERQKKPLHVTPYSIIGVGGSPHTVMEIITGHKVVRLGCDGFQGKNQYTAERAAKLDELRDKLVAVQKAGKLIVGGTGGLGGPEVKVPGLYYNHSYAVLKYDRATDMVSYWNPMGNKFTPKGPVGLENGYVTSRGRFEVPLSEAVQWFGSFSVETDEPLP